MGAAWQRRLPSMLTLGTLVLAIACLYFGRPVLIPAATAVLLTFLLAPAVTWLQRRRLPRALAVGVVASVAGLAVAGVAWLFTSQLLLLATELPVYQDNITRRITELRGHSEHSLIGKLQDFAKEIQAAATSSEQKSTSTGFPPISPYPAPEVPQEVTVVATPSGWPSEMILSALGPIVEPIASTGLVIVLVIFFLLSREDIRNRMISLFGQGHIIVTTKALDDAGQRISRYLAAQFVLNLSFGVVIGVGLFLLGVPYALLWGVLAGFLRYIPLLGPWMAAILPLSLSLLLSTGWWQPLGVVALFVTFELISNLVVEPLVYGQSIGVSQAALILAIAFWTWLWGPMGLVLAAPLTVCLVVLGKHVPHFRFFDIMLGDQPALSIEGQYYQRLLAHDQDEASDVAREQFRALSPEQVYDRLFIPALVYAKRDLESQRLASDDMDYIVESTREIVEEHSPPLPPAEPAEGRPAPILNILGCAACDEADEAALEMFRRLLDPQVCRLDILSVSRLVSEVVTQVEEDRPSIVCVAGLPPGGVAHTRLLCKRLRSRFPQLKIVVARWGQQSSVQATREQLLAAGADQFGTSLEETSAQLVQLAQLLRPEDTAPAPVRTPRPHFVPA
jgi:predicted PurR-regulated permease PerM